MLLYATLGEKYGMLPSQVAEHGTLLDYMAYDVKNSWDEYHSLDTNGKVGMMAKNLSEDDLKTLMAKSKRK